MSSALVNVFRVAECKDMMEKIEKIAGILDDRCNEIPEGVYLELYDTLKELYDTKLLIKVNAYSQKKSRNYPNRTKISQQQYRVLAEAHPDKYAICPICDTGMLKENIKLHYQNTQKCKDIYYTKRGVEMCGECIDPLIKSLISEIYGEPVPPLPQELIDASNNAPNYNFGGQHANHHQ